MECVWKWKAYGKDPSSLFTDDIKGAKKDLRSAQCQLVITQRKSLLVQVIDAHESDTDLFYQSGTNGHSANTIDFGEGVSQVEGWARYFE